MKPSLDDLRHPLSGQKIDLSRYGQIGAEAEKQAERALREEFQKLKSLSDEPSALFVALWGLLPWQLKFRSGEHELKALWDWLPAETRMPNHPIHVHQSLTSAIASILKETDEPSLLSFTIGPVQKFISMARRTSDLWGGSSLLSACLLHAMIPLVEQFGPDHILFPNLRRSNAFLKWLLEDSDWKQQLTRFYSFPGEGDGSILALPNRFLALVPSTKAAAIGAECENSARAWWRKQVEEAAGDLERQIPEIHGYSTMAQFQGEAFFQVFWASTPWPASEKIELNDDPCRRVAWIKGEVLPPSISKFIEAASENKKDNYPSFIFKPNGGILYAAAYESVEAFLAAVKQTRFPACRSEGGLKCSLCGERSVFPMPISFEEQKAIWRQAALSLGRQGYIRRGEALCGVCWTKRLYGKKAQRVPSTAEIAATPFKLKILSLFDRLEPQIAALVSALEKGAENYLDAFVLPILARQKSKEGLRGQFAGISGEILLGYPRERHEIEQESGVRIPDEVFHRLRELRRAAYKLEVPPPRPYLSVLMLDGDQMGMWLSGAKNRPLGDYLSQKAASLLREEGLGEYLDIAWPMTPAMHGSFSEACGVFSQRTAPRTLHEENLPSFLVYAGGDDVLAFSSIGCHDPDEISEFATEAAFNLRMRFSGHVSRKNGTDVPDPKTESGFVLDPKQGISLAFGRYASASAGIAVFHHKWPLNRALTEVRKAENYAKEKLGRDALAISILRRSGQITFSGLGFFQEDGQNAIKSFQTICHAFAFDYLSPKFVSEIKSRFSSFHGGLQTNLLMELARPIIRQALINHCQNDSKREALLEAVTRLAEATRSKSGDADEALKPSADYEHLMRWIDLIEAAAFMGRGEEP
jgi:CRISPR-associated protein Cmr2